MRRSSFGGVCSMRLFSVSTTSCLRCLPYTKSASGRSITRAT
ncbi:hypothetical protein PF003_g10776 [Phytophthora fragariae]|nr:hypothetical protein PF003_g10776 [Phytophthora fragariae]